MIEADRADHSRAKLDHDLIVSITNRGSEKLKYFYHMIALVFTKTI